MKAALFALLAAASLLAQTAQRTCDVVSPAAARSEFDAASVKPAGPFKPGQIGISGGPGGNDPGRVSAERVSLSNLIMRAYDLQTDQITGPGWISNAQSNGFAISATLPATSTREEYCGMLRNLLASRFHLTFHIEKQPRPSYELTVLPGGPKFKKYDPNAPAPEPLAGRRVDASGFTILAQSQERGMGMALSRTGLIKMTFRDDMAIFARDLGPDINSSNGLRNAPTPRVVDKTSLDGVYDIRLEFASTQPDPNAGAPDPSEGPNIFNAVQQQLGLKLTKVKDVPVDVLIIDHADQTPTEN